MSRGSVSNRTKRGRGFEARWWDTDADGKRRQHSKTFDTRADANRYLNRVLGDDRGGKFAPVSSDQITFGALAKDWLEHLDPSLKPSTVASYNGIVHAYLLPAFEYKPINSISPMDIQNFINGLVRTQGPRAGEPVTTGTKRNILRVLNPIMNHAMLDRRIAVNPVATWQATRRMPKGKPRQEPAFLSASQVRELSDEVGERWAPLIMTAAYTGLRAGELAGLQVKDIDAGQKRLYVRQSVTDVNGHLIVAKPKTGVTRNLSIPSFLISELEPLISKRGKDEYVFGSDRPYKHKWFYAKVFIKARDRLVESETWPERLNTLRFHDLRHTAASLAIKTGAHPKTVQERLGHSSISITMDRYGHLYEGHDEELAGKLNELFKKA